MNDNTTAFIKEIEDKENKQADIIIIYSCALSFTMDWEAVNKAIIERWSMSGLCTIKTKAWKNVTPIGE